MALSDSKPILIIGGGISGITAAVEIAEVGREVILVEKESYLGGNVIRMNNYFPKLCPPACGLEINFRRIRQNPRIRIFTGTELKSLSGGKGNFTATLVRSPQYVKDTCTACGKCSEVCPEERPDAFNFSFSHTKAIYLPHAMAFPNKYAIDDTACLKEQCAKCLDVCSYDAIDLKAESMEFTLEAGSVIVATGWKNYPAEALSGLHYREYANVVSNVEFERLIAPGGPGNGKLLRPSDQCVPGNIVFVQCAGSRDENYLAYCSAVCCSASLKHALTIREKYPESKIKIFYIDLRVTGRNEDFLERVKNNPGIELIKGKVAKISELPDTRNLVVEAEDILAGRKIKQEADLVVLATGIMPEKPKIDLDITVAGFISGDQVEGIYPVACCRKPMDVSFSVKDATAAAMKAIQI